ncbi:protein MALE DISCOVERER 2 [Elaeis guineensis]|uniref:Inactive receptor-like serine/threonine-protein kinase At2g40270 n=1 Tax=Elaeis guineensis var. tenera TaxID=51953 RepID=A0A6I9R8I8_ELAGV|nr:inactive receptor-like serine/threonine-protein kinase At2g40270 [Elaeis guineensis]
MESWRLRLGSFLLWVSLLYQRLELCVSINAEGRALLRFKKRVEVDPCSALSNWNEGDADPCSWFGVVCSDDGRVVALNLKDLCLKGKLAPELGKLIHMKSLNLYNNSFYGVIPSEIGELQKLEVLDLGHNYIDEPLPPELGTISSLEILVLRNDKFVGDTSPEIHELNVISEIQVDEQQLSSSRKQVTRNVENATMRRLLRAHEQPPNKSPSHAPESSPTQPLALKLAIGGASLLLVLSAVYLLCYRANKVVTVMPWRTGLSGQLQKAFVTGVPSLRRPELEIACEGFSNIVGSLSDFTLYKGTLSSGIEIAVTSTMVTLAKDWLEQYEAHFRKKISLLSKINHKNFMNLLGYCEEEEPFTRMLVFEYAPNGTLFEHLHIKEAEQLDWAARLRVAMGIVYCLEHMHQLNPPVVLRNLNSSSIYLTEDYAAKISDLGFSDLEKEHESASDGSDQESIVYKFGIILLEIISGRLQFSQDDGLLVLWASGYLTGKRPLKDMVDPTLGSVREEDLSALCEVIRSCINPEPKERPTMAEVASQMRLITAMPPVEATPKLSPLWWAELEILHS